MIDPRLHQLAQNIRHFILDSTYSPADVARHLGVDRSAVSRWMNGERTPTVQNLIDLAKLLEVEVTELWTGPVAIPATPEQRTMLERMANMTPEQQQAFLAIATSIIGAKSG